MLPFDTPPENICIVRLSALGDVTHAVPVLRAIQKNWPTTRVTWICATTVHPLLSALEGVRFIVIDKKSGWHGYRQLRRELGGERFDIMLQMQTSARANITGACVKADIKLGWDKNRARDFHRFFMTHSIPKQVTNTRSRGIYLLPEQSAWTRASPNGIFQLARKLQGLCVRSSLRELESC